MKQLILASAAILALGLSGCASTPDSTNDVAAAEATKVEMEAETKSAKVEEKEKKKSKSDKKKQKGLSKTFAATPEDLKTATLVAMKKVGFSIKKEGGMKIEGKRSHKVGLAVGSGGEKMYAEIIPMEDGESKVHVRTKKTLVGIVGQKNWDDEVMELITESLEGKSSADPMTVS